MFRTSRAYDRATQTWGNDKLFKPTKGEAPYGRPLRSKAHDDKDYVAPKRIRLGVGFWEFDKKAARKDKKNGVTN